jgi:drug/metabolite transporter (DMT)-like permease
MTTRLSTSTLGIVIALFAYGTYSTADAVVKFLGNSLNVFEIGLFITVFSILPALLFKPKTEQWRDTFKFRRPVLMHAIGVTRMIAALCATFAFVTIPLAEVYCIVFLIPIFTALLSIIILKEKVSAARALLMLLSFAGVLLVVRPGFRELQLGHLATLLCAVLAAASVVMTRLVSNDERRISLFVIPGVYSFVVNGIAAAIVGFGDMSLVTLLWLITGGIIGGIGYLLQIKSLELSPASLVAPAQYTQIAWALFFGALFFQEFPDALGIAGLVVVVIAGVGNVVADGARARIAGRWAEYRAAQPAKGPTGLDGPGPDPV